MKKLFSVIAISTLCTGFYTTHIQAETIDCETLPHWTDNTAVPINQVHVFCGEWNREKPKGFHARPDGKTPNTVGSIKVTQRPNAQGLYGVRWKYEGHEQRSKFSSLFPDSCSYAQIIASIEYAAQSPKSCPAGSPSWAKCGDNRPQSRTTTADTKYCHADNDSLFTIAYATLRNGKINTAFPIIER